MKATYLIPRARNLATKETVTHMELGGQRFAAHERAVCKKLADALAEKMTARTNEQWTGFVDTVVQDHKA